MVILMGENGLSASDVALLNNDGMGGNGWGGMIWLFAILAMMGGGFNFGGGYRPQYATQDFVQNGFNFNDLQDQNRDIMNAINLGTSQAVATTNQVYHDIMAGIYDKYGELQRDVAALQVGQANLLANQNECCCNLRAQLM
jgi:hypothetical protein